MMKLITEDLQETLDLYGKEVKDNLRIIQPKDLSVPRLFRIDLEVPKLFTPQMPFTAASSENRSVPRVVTATTLMGCLCGHAHVFWLVATREPGAEFKNNFYKISGFEFEYAAVPNEKLVFDSKETGEVWLLAYDKATTAYKPIPWGEMFVHRVSIEARGSEKINRQVSDFLVRVDDPMGLPLNFKRHLNKGYYYISLDITHYGLSTEVTKDLKTKRLTAHDDEKMSVTSITPAVYQSFFERSVGKRRG